MFEIIVEIVFYIAAVIVMYNLNEEMNKDIEECDSEAEDNEDLGI